MPDEYRSLLAWAIQLRWTIETIELFSGVKGFQSRWVVLRCQPSQSIPWYVCTWYLFWNFEGWSLRAWIGCRASYSAVQTAERFQTSGGRRRIV
jgi:hypothetical protein